MNRYLFRLSLAGLILALLLLGCGKSASDGKLPSDPKEAIKEISTASQNLKTAHFTMDLLMDMDAEGFAVKLEMNAEGDVEMKGPSPEDANLYMDINMSMLGQQVEMEMVAVDGKFWMREGLGSWQEVPAEQANLTGGLGGDPATALRYLEKAKNVKKLGDEKVDGVDCYHYGFTMDASALDTPEMLGQLTGGGALAAEQAQEMIETAVLDGEVWAGKDDLYARRQKMDMKFKIAGLPGLGDAVVEYDMQIDMKFSELNEPVEIKAPTN